MSLNDNSTSVKFSQTEQPLHCYVQILDIYDVVVYDIFDLYKITVMSTVLFANKTGNMTAKIETKAFSTRDA